MSGWSKRDLAFALGLRALGEDYGRIAYLLHREADDVRAVVFKARCLCQTEGWLCTLLDRHDGRQKLPVDLPQSKTWLPRKFTVPPVVDHAKRPGTAEITATLMGDPIPGRSALDQSRQMET
ncbi:MAG: hypothetical protein ABJG23_03985 [Marinobacter sp.]